MDTMRLMLAEYVELIANSFRDGGSAERCQSEIERISSLQNEIEEMIGSGAIRINKEWVDFLGYCELVIWGITEIKRELDEAK
jgi:hypothetical protein